MALSIPTQSRDAKAKAKAGKTGKSHSLHGRKSMASVEQDAAALYDIDSSRGRGNWEKLQAHVAAEAKKKRQAAMFVAARQAGYGTHAAPSCTVDGEDEDEEDNKINTLEGGQWDGIVKSMWRLQNKNASQMLSMYNIYRRWRAYAGVFSSKKKLWGWARESRWVYGFLLCYAAFYAFEAHMDTFGLVSAVCLLTGYLGAEFLGDAVASSSQITKRMKSALNITMRPKKTRAQLNTAVKRNMLIFTVIAALASIGCILDAQQSINLMRMDAAAEAEWRHQLAAAPATSGTASSSLDKASHSRALLATVRGVHEPGLALWLADERAQAGGAKTKDAGAKEPAAAHSEHEGGAASKEAEPAAKAEPAATAQPSVDPHAVPSRTLSPPVKTDGQVGSGVGPDGVAPTLVAGRGGRRNKKFTPVAVTVPTLTPPMPASHLNGNFRHMGVAAIRVYQFIIVLVWFRVCAGLSCFVLLVQIHRIKVISAFRRIGTVGTDPEHAIRRLVDIDLSLCSCAHKFANNCVTLCVCMFAYFLLQTTVRVTAGGGKYIQKEAFAPYVILNVAAIPQLLIMAVLVPVALLNKDVAYLMKTCALYAVEQRQADKETKRLTKEFTSYAKSGNFALRIGGFLITMSTPWKVFGVSASEGGSSLLSGFQN